MNGLKMELDELEKSIKDLEIQIKQAEIEAENNIRPLELELASVRKNKRKYALKGDFDSVQSCIRRENNLKFKISAQWNKYSILKEDLSRLKSERNDLKNQIKLKKDQTKRKNQILAQMDKVIKNYRKTQNLTHAAVTSNISPDHVRQWMEWGKNDYNEIYSYFYSQITEADEYFKELETQKLKKQMNEVAEAYKKTKSLREASKIADVSYDTVMYWYEWGSRGFGEENAYFFRKIKSM